MIRFKVLMIAFRIYTHFHGPLFSLILMGFVLTTCYPVLSSSTITYSPVLMLFPNHGVIVFHHIMTYPLSGIGLPFVLIMGKPMYIKSYVFVSQTS